VAIRHLRVKIPAPSKAVLSCTDLHVPSDGRGISKYVQTDCALRNSYVLEGLAEVGTDYAYGQLCIYIYVCVCVCIGVKVQTSTRWMVLATV